MNLSYSKFLPILSFVLIALLAFVIVMSFQMNLPVNQEVYFLMPLLLVLTMPMLFVKHLQINEREIIVRNQFGMIARRYSINNQKEIEVIGKNILINKKGNLEKIKFSYFMSDKGDFLKMKRKLEKIKSYGNN